MKKGCTAMSSNRDNLSSRRTNRLLAAIAKGTQGDASYCVMKRNATVNGAELGTFSFRGSFEEAKALAIQYARYLKGNTASVSKTGATDHKSLFCAYQTIDGFLLDTVTQTPIE